MRKSSIGKRAKAYKPKKSAAKRAGKPAVPKKKDKKYG